MYNAAARPGRVLGPAEASALSTQTIQPGKIPHTGQRYALVKGGGTTCAIPRTISSLSFLHPILHPACHTHFAGGQPISSHRAPNSRAPASTRQYQAHISPATPTHPKIGRQPSRLVCFRKDMMQRQQPVWLNARRCFDATRQLADVSLVYVLCT